MWSLVFRSELFFFNSVYCISCQCCISCVCVCVARFHTVYQFVLRYCHFKIKHIKLLIYRICGNGCPISFCIPVHVVFFSPDVNNTVSSAICLENVRNDVLLPRLRPCERANVSWCKSSVVFSLRPQSVAQCFWSFCSDVMLNSCRLELSTTRGRAFLILQWLPQVFFFCFFLTRVTLDSAILSNQTKRSKDNVLSL